MKATILCIDLIVTSLMLVVQIEAKIDLETAMGIWLFDGNKGKVAKDISGNDNHGDIQGPKWVKGKSGSALKFNGSTDRVVIADSDSLYAKKAWTITSWIFVNNSETGYGHIIGKRSGAGTNYAFRTNNVGLAWDAYFSSLGGQKRGMSIHDGHLRWEEYHSDLRKWGGSWLGRRRKTTTSRHIGSPH